jgi:HlyD family secretion protein
LVDIPRQAPNRKRKRLIYIGVAVAALAAITLALASLPKAAPTVDGGTVWRDKVKRGPMLRQVRGPGTLVPKEIRWISAVTAGRVERKLMQPGQAVQASTVLLELSNPDVLLAALEAQRQLASAQAELVNLRATLETQRLNQQSTVATTRMQFQEARRQVQVAETLATKGLIAANELERMKDNMEEVASRYDSEQKQLVVLSEGQKAQLSVQAQQVARLRSIVEFRQDQIASMNVVAGAEGVLTEIPLEVGQWANPGATLAKVVQPGSLKAVLRIPETQAKDVTIGQPAQIDTRNGIIQGHVVRMDPAAQNGTVGVDVALQGELPRGARPDLSVDGTIEIERLDNVLYMGRPAYGQSESTVEIFKLESDGKTAIRTRVKLGRTSVNTIEIVDGLREGDTVILSDMSNYENFERIRLR